MGPSSADPRAHCTHFVCRACCTRIWETTQLPLTCPLCRRDTADWFRREFGRELQEEWHFGADQYSQRSDPETERRREDLRVFNAAFDEWERRWALLRARPGMNSRAQYEDLALFEDAWRFGYRGPEV